MTEQELITSLQALSSDARTVLAKLVPFAEQDTEVVFTLSNGQTVTVPSLPRQIATYAEQQDADRLAFLQNFGGMPAAQTIERDSANRLFSVMTTFATGYRTQQTLIRDALTGQITGLTIVCMDASGNALVTLTKTLVRDGGLYSGVQ